MNQGPKSDTLNERIGVLTRREVEARILGPIVEALGAEFGAARVREVVGQTVVAIACKQGAELAEAMGGDSLECFERSLAYWTKDDALCIEVLERSGGTLSFDVTRCRYAEMYRELGIPELGTLLSCNRDFALIEGFNASVNLERTQTIMQGAQRCDFRYSIADDSE